MRIPSGSTDRYIYFVAVDSTDLKTREQTLTTFTVYGSLNGAASSLWTTPTVNETDTTNMPGVYELLLDEQTTLTAGNDTEELCLHITQASMAPVTRTVEIYRPETTEGNTLDVTATGAAGVDWGNVENKTTSNALTGTTVADTQKVDIETIKTNAVVNGGTITFPTTATLASTTNITAGTIADVTNDVGITQAAADKAWSTASRVLTAGTNLNDIAAADVWAVDATTQQTQGTFGQAIGDPVADTTTIYQSVATDATGDNIAVDIVAVKAETVLIVEDTGTTIPGTITTLQSDTDDIQTRLPAALVNSRMDATIDATGFEDAAVDKVWDEDIVAAHNTADTAGAILNNILPEKNAAFNDIEWLWVAASDHVTPVTGAGTMSVTRSIDGGAFGSGTGTGPTEVGNGVYVYDASAADMNGTVITFRFVATSGTPGAPDDAFVTIKTSG